MLKYFNYFVIFTPEYFCHYKPAVSKCELWEVIKNDYKTQTQQYRVTRKAINWVLERVIPCKVYYIGKAAIFFSIDARIQINEQVDATLKQPLEKSSGVNTF